MKDFLKNPFVSKYWKNMAYFKIIQSGYDCMPVRCFQGDLVRAREPLIAHSLVASIVCSAENQADKEKDK